MVGQVRFYLFFSLRRQPRSRSRHSMKFNLRHFIHSWSFIRPAYMFLNNFSYTRWGFNQTFIFICYKVASMLEYSVSRNVFLFLELWFIFLKIYFYTPWKWKRLSAKMICDVTYIHQHSAINHYIPRHKFDGIYCIHIFYTYVYISFMQSAFVHVSMLFLYSSPAYVYRVNMISVLCI